MLLDVDSDQITPATFRVVRESLGFTLGSFARLASVKTNTVNDWDSGRSYVPRGVVELLRECERDADALMNAYVEALRDHPAPTLQTYESDDTYRQAEPDSKYPAAWHRMVAGRVWEQVPNLHINYI